MSWPWWLAAVGSRGLALSALAALVGGLALDALVLPRGDRQLDPARTTLRRWSAACAAALLVATGAELVVRSRVMAGGGLAAAVRAIPIVLARTHFGAVWAARAAVLATLLIVAPAAARGARVLALLLAGAVALGTSLTGHAADQGDLSGAAFIDWLHVLAASTWTGGLFGLTLLGVRGRVAWTAPAVVAVARRFSTLAGVCLLVVLGSGVYNAWTQLGAASALLTTSYGRALAVKLAAVLALAGLGAVSRYVIIPRLRREPAGAGRLLANIGREAALAILVFGCTAVLGVSSPPRHRMMGPAPAAGVAHEMSRPPR